MNISTLTGLVMIEILRACTYTCMQLGVMLIICDNGKRDDNNNGTFSEERAEEENGKRKDYKGSFLFLCYGLV